MKHFILAIIFCLPIISVFAQTPGMLTVSALTSETGGNYAPRNVVAIWIEDDTGNWVKTLLAYAQNRRTHLNTWQAATAAAGSEYNTVDAVTGATRSNHDTRMCSWDGTDVNGDLVTDGTYRVWMELTDKNNTGNFSSFAFTKSDIADNLTPFDVPSFGSITISWEPDGPTAIFENSKENNIAVYPNPGTGQYTISGEEIFEIEIRTISGQLVLQGKDKYIDISDQPDGVYLLIVNSKGNDNVIRLVKD